MAAATMTTATVETATRHVLTAAKVLSAAKVLGPTEVLGST
jgi:hypothetical protein